MHAGGFGRHVAHAAESRALVLRAHWTLTPAVDQRDRHSLLESIVQHAANGLMARCSALACLCQCQYQLRACKPAHVRQRLVRGVTAIHSSPFKCSVLRRGQCVPWLEVLGARPALHVTAQYVQHRASCSCAWLVDAGITSECTSKVPSAFLTFVLRGPADVRSLTIRLP